MALLNRAFTAAPAWWLLCPYDTTSVEADILQSARSNHPLLRTAESGPNSTYQDVPYPFPDLTAPCDTYQELVFHAGDLAQVRDKVAACASAHHLDSERLPDLLAAVTEAAANSIRHGGGTGSLRTWTERGELVCEVRDSGHLEDALAGHLRPRYDQRGGRGLWLIHQLCDLVQIRTGQDGTTVRMITALR